MEYRKFGSDYILRIDLGEEVLTQIQELCVRERITLGTVSGLGACGEATLGVFNRERFAYETAHYTGDFEIASCYGTVSTMDGKPYLHIHAAIANPVKGLLYGGHLNRAVVSLTGEFTVHAIAGTVEREYSPEVGLNLFQFTD